MKNSKAVLLIAALVWALGVRFGVDSFVSSAHRASGASASASANLVGRRAVGNFFPHHDAALAAVAIIPRLTPVEFVWGDTDRTAGSSQPHPHSARAPPAV